MLISGSEMRLTKPSETKRDSVPVYPRAEAKRGSFMKTNFVNIFYVLEVG